MKDLEELQASVAGTIARAKARAQSNETTDATGPAANSEPIVSSSVQLARLRSAVAQQQQCCAALMEDLQAVRAARQQEERGAAQQRRNLDMMQHRLEITQSALALANQRRRDVARRIEKEKSKMDDVLRLRKELAVTMLQTQDAMERLITKMGPHEKDDKEGGRA